MVIFKLSLCGGFLRFFALVPIEHQHGLLVYTIRVTLAIYGGDNLQLSKVSPVRFHWRPNGLIIRRKTEGSHGHS
jgi:hypothetical protein